MQVSTSTYDTVTSCTCSVHKLSLRDGLFWGILKLQQNLVCYSIVIPILSPHLSTPLYYDLSVHASPESVLIISPGFWSPLLQNPKTGSSITGSGVWPWRIRGTESRMCTRTRSDPLDHHNSSSPPPHSLNLVGEARLNHQPPPPQRKTHYVVSLKLQLRNNIQNKSEWNFNVNFHHMTGI